ncbi:helix-turn-helix domain-containing protein [Kineococcus glutinatus]|uniref:HTH cro/C1-type domain-containing protein n=1 Tax=Kineococcus glutinatus TaxID=1070872 RepID=A0ABP9HEH8_9ACTN
MAVIDSAAALLCDARQRAGMTQAEVGRRAGVAQSVVSAYESGQRQPSLPVLLALIAATGHAVDADLVPAPPNSPPLSGRLGRRVQRHRHHIKKIAAAQGASNVRIFGSVARGDERPGSDVDVLLDLPEGAGLFTLARLRQELEDLLGVSVDVVPADGLKPDVRASVDADAVTL